MVDYSCCIASHAQAAYHEPLVSAWFEIVSTDYKDSQYISSSDAVSEADARTNALWVLVCGLSLLLPYAPSIKVPHI